ncbi:MAG: hypothetical protein R6U58_12530 [Bacteroidales bacterium]
MEKEELLKRTYQEIEDINKRIAELNDRIKDEKTDASREKTKSVIKKLEEIRDKIRSHYVKLDRTGGGETKNITKIEKNIYTDIRSFEDAFKNAGRIFSSMNR